MYIYPAPSYIADFVSKVSEELLFEIQETYGESTTAFRFDNEFTKLVQTWIKKTKNFGGTIWGIDREGGRVMIFNQAENGYNGVMQNNTEEEDLDSTKEMQLSTSTDIIVAFQYNGDEADYIDEGTSEFAQDYFAWVIVYECTDNLLTEIFSYECA